MPNLVEISPVVYTRGFLNIFSTILLFAFISPLKILELEDFKNIFDIILLFLLLSPLGERCGPVSYTHLTLPTICSV